MKTLVLYATKHGAAAEVAERITQRMEDAEMYDLAAGKPPALDGYDCVVVGGSVYASMLRKPAKAYLAQNEEALRGKKLGLYVCSIAEEGAPQYFETNFPKELLACAAAKAHLGGRFDPASCSAFERFIMKTVAHTAEPVDALDDAAIDAFVQQLKG